MASRRIARVATMNAELSSGEGEATRAHPAISPSSALLKSIPDAAVDALALAGDVLVDSMISSGALDGVPILGLALGARRAIRGLRDELDARKIVQFLRGLGGASEESRREFVAKMQRDTDYHRFGTNVLLLIERADALEKPLIIGRLVAAHIRGDIPELNRTMRIAGMVDRSYVPDLIGLRLFRAGVQTDLEATRSLVSVGLVHATMQIVDGNPPVPGEEPQNLNEYDLTDAGKVLVRYGLTAEASSSQ